MSALLGLTLALSLGAAPEAWKTLPPPVAMPTPDERGVAQVNGVALAWARYGHGEPVLLLHGGAGNGEHWANQVPALAAQYQVLVVDARGHGRSTLGDRPLSYALMADDVVALMDTLELPRAAVVGWSDGGIVGLDLALRYPQRLTRLVAYAANYDLTGLQHGGGATFQAYFARCAHDYARLSPTPKGFAALQAKLSPMWRTQPTYTAAQLSGVTVPTLVLDGAHDEIIRQAHLKELARLVPGARLELLADASHFALFQQPKAFNDAVLAFLREQP
jgi:pimeloyl-ACP methyl ester carboxylesterase